MTRTVGKVASLKDDDLKEFYFLTSGDGNVWHREAADCRPDDADRRMHDAPIALTEDAVDALQGIFDLCQRAAFKAGKACGIETGKRKGQRKAWREMINLAIKQITNQ